MAILPEPLPRWKVTKSEAKSYAARGFYTMAVREFTEILPPDIDANTKTPLKVVVEIRDTAGEDRQLVPFRLTEEQLQRSQMKKGQWRSYPMIQLNDGDAEAESVRLLIRGRWIVQLTYPDNDLNAAQRWLTQLKLYRISDLNYLRYKNDPNVVPIQVIDELNPQRNSKYWKSVTTDADLEALAKKIEAEYRRMGWKFSKDELEAQKTPEESPSPDSS
ncbi:MAG: hypothetical protein AAF585_03390 [Verrucomicrobiota bacterium]